jgi:hypothetical protein
MIGRVRDPRRRLLGVDVTATDLTENRNAIGLEPNDMEVGLHHVAERGPHGGQASLRVSNACKA